MQSALMLGIRRDDPDVKILAVHLRAERHADALREPFAQRTRGRFDARASLTRSGCPCSREPNLRSVNSSSTGK